MSKFGEIYESIKDVSDAEIRISPDETVYIINLTAKEAEKVLAATDDGAETLFESSVSCIGATICQVGVRDSQGLWLRHQKNMILRTVYCRRSIFPDVLHPVGHIRLERSVSTAE